VGENPTPRTIFLGVRTRNIKEFFKGNFAVLFDATDAA
jgi:hypothetical protein